MAIGMVLYANDTNRATEMARDAASIYSSTRDKSELLRALRATTKHAHIALRAAQACELSVAFQIRIHPLLEAFLRAGLRNLEVELQTCLETLSQVVSSLTELSIRCGVAVETGTQPFPGIDMGR